MAAVAIDVFTRVLATFSLIHAPLVCRCCVSVSAIFENSHITLQCIDAFWLWLFFNDNIIAHFLRIMQEKEL